MLSGSTSSASSAAIICRFKPARARQIIAEVLRSKLTGAAYNADNTSTWTREIADEIKQKLKSALPAFQNTRSSTAAAALRVLPASKSGSRSAIWQCLAASTDSCHRFLQVKTGHATSLLCRSSLASSGARAAGEPGAFTCTATLEHSATQQYCQHTAHSAAASGGIARMRQQLHAGLAHSAVLQ